MSTPTSSFSLQGSPFPTSSFLLGFSVFIVGGLRLLDWSFYLTGYHSWFVHFGVLGEV